MKKIVALVAVIALSLGLFVFGTTSSKQAVSAETHNFVVSNFEELKSAVAKGNASDLVYITLASDITIESDLTVKGNVYIKANAKEKLIFEKGSSKTGISLSKNSNLTVDNVTVVRNVVAETEKFLFYTYEKGITLTFIECAFNVATAEIASISYDRIVYSSTAGALVCYLNNCEFNTQGYFYRGTYVVYNCDVIPANAGSAVIQDFTSLKINYENGQLTFPADTTVSEDEAFTKNVKSGSLFKSDFTYYVLKNGFSFSFTTRNLKYETPTEANVEVDYGKETIEYNEDEYGVYSDSALTQTVASGSTLTPGGKLYVVRKANGIFLQSDVFEFALPVRPEARQLKADFVCSFGFAMEYFINCEYRVNGGEWQKEPVFIGLHANTEYTVDMRIASTQKSFVSEVYTITVKTTVK